jgi:hypothetical protein
MKRFHIAIAVKDLNASIVDYNQRLSQPATAIVPGKYAMWRTTVSTSQSINCLNALGTYGI